MNPLGRVQAYLAFLCVQSDLSWHVVRNYYSPRGKNPCNCNCVSPSYSVALDPNQRLGSIAKTEHKPSVFTDCEAVSVATLTFLWFRSDLFEGTSESKPH
jgi:hypothetical protein